MGVTRGTGRPKVYRLASGERCPGVTTICSRFKESGGLIHWAWKEGLEGRDYRETRDAAADAGTLAHKMVETYIHSRKGDGAAAFSRWADQIRETVADPEMYEAARTAFNAFLKWKDQTRLTITHTEVPLISEEHRFGGTLDAMVTHSGRSLCDWKTGGGVYPDHLCQLAAYGILWDENHPDDPITGGYYLLRFDKEDGGFTDRWKPQLDVARRQFLRFREAYDDDQTLRRMAR